MGFWLVNTIAICTMLVNGAVSSLGDCGLPCGRRDSLCTLQLFCSALLRTSSIAATLGMSGWLLLTQQGLSPCQKRQASLDAPTIQRHPQPRFCGGRVDAFVSRFLQFCRNELEDSVSLLSCQAKSNAIMTRTTMSCHVAWDSPSVLSYQPNLGNSPVDICFSISIVCTNHAP